MARWLLKSEPDVFSYDDLVRAGREGWDGIRSYQSRNFLREMRRGEQAIFYHSNAKPPGVAGICKIVKTAEPDPTQFDPTSKYYDPASKPEDPRWDWVTVAPVRALPFVSLDELRTLPELANCRLLAKGNRLSVTPAHRRRVRRHRQLRRSVVAERARGTAPFEPGAQVGIERRRRLVRSSARSSSVSTPRQRPFVPLKRNRSMPPSKIIAEGRPVVRALRLLAHRVELHRRDDRGPSLLAARRCRRTRRGGASRPRCRRACRRSA